jgi:hypothetical protein
MVLIGGVVALRAGVHHRAGAENAATTSDGAPTDVLAATTSSSATDAPLTTDPTPTEPPPVAASPAAPKTSPSPTAEGVPATPEDPHVVDAASSPAVVDDTTTATLTVDPSEPEPGQLMTVKLHVHNRRADTQVSVMLNPVQGLHSGANDCGSSAITAIDQDLSWTTAFRVGGTRDVVLEVVNCAGTRTDFKQTVAIPVGAGIGPANGPRPPVLTDLYQDADGSLRVGAFDEDGTPNTFVVDWGDGSAPETFTVPASTDTTCSPGSEYGPSGYRMNVSHNYATTGTYDVTVTAVSFGFCHEDPQTVSGAITLAA